MSDQNQHPCPNFGICGGCYYGTPYKEQRRDKQQFLQQLFEQDIQIEPSPVVTGYRGRMDFVTAFGKVGLRKRKQFDQVVDIDHCHLISENMNRVLKRVKELLKKHQITDYDYINHQGYLRYVSLREAKFTGQIMVIFLTASYDESILKVIEEIQEKVTSVVWSFHDGLREGIFGTVYQTFGSDHILEELNGIKYKISPYSFFQSNSYVAQVMFQKIREYVPGRNGLDLYCGVGAITLYTADRTEHMTGVENVEEAIELARDNASLNNISNVTFYCQQTQEYLENLQEKIDLIIADPPRKGLGKKTTKRLLEQEAPRLILMSCNPHSLKWDLGKLSKKYKVNYIQAFDMFPYTDHIEMLAVLDKKE